MTPFGLAFEELDEYDGEPKLFIFNNKWNSIESIIDIVFIFELMINFNTSFL